MVQSHLNTSIQHTVTPDDFERTGETKLNKEVAPQTMLSTPNEVAPSNN